LSITFFNLAISACKLSIVAGAVGSGDGCSGDGGVTSGGFGNVSLYSIHHCCSFHHPSELNIAKPLYDR